MHSPRRTWDPIQNSDQMKNILDDELIEFEKYKVNIRLRVINYIFDSFCLCILILIYFIFHLKYIASSHPTLIESYFKEFQLPVIMFFSIRFAYYFLFEYFTNKTIGKYFTKTILQSRSGGRLTINQCFIRSISRLIPFEGLSLMFWKNECIHDWLSNTIVVKVDN